MPLEFNSKINETQNSLDGLFAKAQKNLDNISNKIDKIAATIGKTTFPDQVSFVSDLTTIGANIVNITNEWGDFKDNLVLAKDFFGGMGEQIAVAAQHLGGLAVEWGKTAIELGKDTISKVTGQLVEMGEALLEGGKHLANLAIEWGKETLAKAASAIKTAIVTAAQWLWNAAASVGAAVTTALGAAFAFLTSPIGLVILAIAAIIAIGVLLWKNWDTIKEFAINLWEKIQPIFAKIGEFIGGVFKGIINAAISMVNLVITAIEAIANAALIPINLIIRGLNLIPGVNIPTLQVSIPKIPKLDVGTNFVPNDQLAMIHKGEAVIPKKFNSQEYFGKGNEETNSLLEKLISRVDAIELNPYITVKDVGDASVKYINKESRIRGESVINV